MKRVFRVPSSDRSARRDVEREIELHLDLRAREFEVAGMAPEEARRAALEAFGDRTAVETEVSGIHQSALHERRRREWLSEARQDLVVGARKLRRSPGFTLVALLTLIIGIGGNTAIFGVLRSVLLRPLPYAHSERLVQLWTDHRARGRAEPEWLAPPDFLDWRAQNTTFSSMAAYDGWGPDLTGGGDPEALRGLTVSGNYFDMLELRPELGRLFTLSDDDAGAERVVVLSHAFWERRFGGQPSVLGRQLSLSGVPWTVVGVLPPDARLPVQGNQPDIVAPMRRPADSRCGRGCVTWHGIGRLEPGVSVAAAQADLDRISAQIARQFPETNSRVGAWLIPLHKQITGATKPALFALSAAAAFVLLIGCVNLANLLLVRGASRNREIGVRAALGAGRGRVVRQLLTENALLAAAGGGLGLVAGIAGTRVLAVLIPESVRQVQAIRVDGEVLGFAAAITVLSSVFFGLVPALHSARTSLMDTLRTTAVQSGRHANALRRLLVVTQLSLAVVLLVGAGLLLRSFLVMQAVDLGYRDHGVYFAGVAFPRARYPNGARLIAAEKELLARLRANPAVRAAEATDLPPLGGGGDQDISVTPVGSPPAPGQPPSIWLRRVTPGYVKLMGIRLVAGRMLSETERDSNNLIGLVNDEAARRYWPGVPTTSVVGRQLATGDGPKNPRITIVGVLGSIRSDGPNQPYKPELYLSLAQTSAAGLALVLEPAHDVASLAAAVRQSLHDVDPLIPASTLDPIQTRVGETLELPRLYASMVGVFAATAVLLATLGVYGVMAYSVAQRQREIGVRLALGAAPSGVARMILGDGSRLAAIGLGVGLICALLVGQAIGKLLFGVSPYDTPTFVAVPLVLGTATLVASWLPARRAMRVDPLVAIREE